MAFRILAANRFKDITRLTGRTALDINSANKNFASLETAVKNGIPLVVNKANRDGHNFIVIEGPNGQLHHRTV